MVNDNFYTTSKAAELLGVTVSTIQRWSNSGELSTWLTAGGHRRIARSSVHKILEQMKKVSLPEDVQSPLNIIIVEDNEQQVRLYKKQISKLPFDTSIIVANNGFNALLKIGSTFPDVIIADLLMPKMDGFMMLKSLSTVPELDNTLVIVITGLTKSEVQLKGEIPEKAHLFTKPVDFGHIENLLYKKIMGMNNSSQDD